MQILKIFLPSPHSEGSICNIFLFRKGLVSLLAEWAMRQLRAMPLGIALSQSPAHAISPDCRPTYCASCLSMLGLPVSHENCQCFE